ncbi:MAG: hypothetical protein VW104_07540, partial [Halieaceae bacterium]
MNALLITGRDERHPPANLTFQNSLPDVIGTGTSAADPATSTPEKLSLPHSSLKSRKGQCLWQIHKVDTDSALRGRTETLVRDQYRAVHGADVKDFFDDLFAISDGSFLMGAIGL